MFDLLEMIVPAIFGGLIASFINGYLNRTNAKRALCFQMYERWISSAMEQVKSDVWEDLDRLFNQPVADGYVLSNRKIQLSELKMLSRDKPNHKSSFSYQNFIRVMLFFSDLEKLMEKKLIDCHLACTIFRNSILPWYDFLDKIDFSSLDNSQYNWLKTGMPKLKKRLAVATRK